jgi:hypothetical protein
MTPVKKQIIIALTASGGELSVGELVKKVREHSDASAADVKAAVLPMISGESIELTPDLRLRLRRAHQTQAI